MHNPICFCSIMLYAYEIYTEYTYKYVCTRDYIKFLGVFVIQCKRMSCANVDHRNPRAPRKWGLGGETTPRVQSLWVLNTLFWAGDVPLERTWSENGFNSLVVHLLLQLAESFQQSFTWLSGWETSNLFEYHTLRKLHGLGSNFAG